NLYSWQSPRCSAEGLKLPHIESTGLPILFLSSFRPIPKSTLSDCARFVGPHIFMQIEAVAVSRINYESHFVIVMCKRLAPFNFCRQVCCRNFCLTNGHVAHRWPTKVHTITHCVHSLNSNDSHGPINI